MDDCIFCKIIKKEIPAEIIYEDEKTLSFLDISPVNKGHALVITKNHHENLYGIPNDDLEYLIKTTQKVSIALKKALNADGINLEMNNGEVAGQVVMHAHIHVIPRFKDDRLKHWPSKTYDDGEMRNVGDKIRNAF